MSNEQPPPDDDQDVAEYHRADASKFPTTPAGQEAAVEGMLAASPFERIADDLNRRRVPTSGPAAALVTDMFELFEKYERERAAARAAQGDTNPYDLAPYEDVHGVTNEYEAARDSDDPRALDRFLDNLAEDFHLDDVRALRMATAAVQAAMGRIALAAREKGMSPDRIAAQTGYTASRIAQFIREEKQRRGSLTRYTWRIDVQNAEGEWTDREAGEDDASPADLIRLAERLLAETGAPGQRARIVLWEGDEGADDDALYSAERDAKWDADYAVDRWEGDHWYQFMAQSRRGCKDRPEDFARYLLEREQGQQPAGARLRVRVWKSGDSDGAPLAEAITDQQ